MEYKDAYLAYHAVGNVHKAYWYATVAAMAHPSTRKVGMQMASYGVRATGAALKGAAVGVGTTTFKRGGQMSLARLPGAAARSLANPYILAGLIGYETAKVHDHRVRTDQAYREAVAGPGARGLFL